MMLSKNLPAQDFEACFLKLYEGAKNAPSLYIKERNLSEAHKLKNMAMAMRAKELAGQAGKLVCLIEWDIAESNPPISKNKTGRGHKKSVAPDATLSKFKLSHMRRAYKNLSESEVCQRADNAIQGGKIPTREMFIKRGELAKTIPRILSRDSHAEYYTPPEIIELARKTMGSIDVDPCSNEHAQKYIKAGEFWTEKEDGLSREWTGNVWFNPPYIHRVIGKWIDKLIRDKGIAQAIVLTNNNTETRWAQSLLNECNAICFPCGRIKFWNKGGGYLKAPLQGQMVIGIRVNPKLFQKNFSQIGVCWQRAVG